MFDELRADSRVRWPDDYLASFAQAADLALATLDRAYAERYPYVRIETLGWRNPFEGDVTVRGSSDCDRCSGQLAVASTDRMIRRAPMRTCPSRP